MLRGRRSHTDSSLVRRRVPSHAVNVAAVEEAHVSIARYPMHSESSAECSIVLSRAHRLQHELRLEVECPTTINGGRESSRLLRRVDECVATLRELWSNCEAMREEECNRSNSMRMALVVQESNVAKLTECTRSISSELDAFKLASTSDMKAVIDPLKDDLAATNLRMSRVAQSQLQLLNEISKISSNFNSILSGTTHIENLKVVKSLQVLPTCKVKWGSQNRRAQHKACISTK
jgi:hypothetical protein